MEYIVLLFSVDGIALCLVVDLVGAKPCSAQTSTTKFWKPAYEADRHSEPP